MRSCNKPYTIKEYGGFTRGVEVAGYQSLPAATFDALEKFILASTSDFDTEAVELMSLSARRNTGKIISARNYVGVIAMTDGTVIEILPKIAGNDISDEETKRIFLRMLKSLRDVTFKEFNISNMKIGRMNLFEIFIKMFLDEVTSLTKQGLKSAYSPIEENEKFFKGKLLSAMNIRKNLVNRAQFYVRYDDFNINRPENRLIKTTIRFLRRMTADDRNRQSTVRLLDFFDGVPCSENCDADFSQCACDRSMSHYGKAIAWCRVFLKGNTFTAYTGSEVAIALLFPMEKIFESYIASILRKQLPPEVRMKTQDSRYSLFDQPSRTFALRPDIVLESGEHTTVLDTKWKMLSASAYNYGISQADMYQMYAYGKKYDADSVVLIFPKFDVVGAEPIFYESGDGVSVEVVFVDLRDPEKSVEKMSEIPFIEGRCSNVL